MERGIWPIGDTDDMAVFDGVPMDVIDVAAKIHRVMDLVLPKPPLPYRALPVFGLG